MNEPLKKAIDIFKTQTALASKIGCSQSMISYWLNISVVPAEYCIPIEKATKRKVRREELRPDIFGGVNA